MAVTVNLNPNVATYTLGDPSISVSLTGGTLAAYLWESNGGIFSDKYAAAPVFTPDNVTRIVSVIGRKVTRAFSAFTGTGTLSTYGSNGGYTKTAGSGAAWDIEVHSPAGLNGANGFFEFTAGDGFTVVREIGEGMFEKGTIAPPTEKAGGLLLNAAYRDPTTVHATNAFQLVWHLSANGTAVPRRLGVALASPVLYRSGDAFRIQVTGAVSTFYLNGILVATTSTPAGNLFASMSFKTMNSTLNNPSFLIDPTTNEGVKNISVVGIVPVQPNYSFDLTEDNVTLSSMAEDGSGTFRVKSPAKKALNLQYTERPYSEYVLMKAFYQAHGRHEKFVYQDLIHNEFYLMRFDAPWRQVVLAPDSITMSFSLREV